MKLIQDNTQPTVIEVDENLDSQVGLLINSKVLAILKKERMDINQLFIMLALYNDYIELLDIYDNESTSKKVLIMEYQDLQIHGFIQSCKENKMFEITEKGKAFVEEIKPLLEPTEEETENAAKLRELCEKYLLIFPKIKLPSNKYARVNVLEIEKKMKTWLRTYRPFFKKNYKFKLTHEDILNATSAYVGRYVKTGYLYMATSSYFIQKDEKSALADEILAMKQGLNQTKTNIVTM